MRASLASFAVVLTLGLTPDAHAQMRVLPPGLEDEVSALVFDGETAVDPAHVDGAHIDRAHIDVSIAGGGRVRLVARGESSDGLRIGDTESFTLWLIEGAGDAELRRAARHLHARVVARDRGGFCDTHAVAPERAERTSRGAPPAAWASSMRWVRALLWIGLLLVLASLVHARHFDRAEIPVALILFGGALALRLVLPWAPLHANDHGISEMRGLTGHPEGYEAGLYGTAYLDFVRVVLAPSSRWADGPFLLGAALGALAPPLLYAAARGLAPGSRFGALAAGMALAIHPMHARLSLSESPRPLAGALWLLGLALAVSALAASGRPRALAWIAAALAWALAAELRVLTILLPIAGPLLVVIARGSWRGRPSIGVMVGMAVVLGGVVLAHSEVLRSALSAASSRPGRFDAALLRGVDPEHAVFLDPTFTPWLFVPLAALCAVRLWMIREHRLVIAALAAFALLFVPSILVWGSRTDAIRYQTDTVLPLLLLFVGLPAPHVREQMAWALVPAALMVSALPSWLDVIRPDVHMQAYAIARDAPAPPVPIVVPPPEMEDRRVRSDFPDYAIARPTRVSTEARRGCAVWIGVACWSFTGDELREGTGVYVEPGAPFREECMDLLGGGERARRALRALAPLDVPHRQEEFHRIVAPAPRVGFAPCPVGETE